MKAESTKEKWERVIEITEEKFPGDGIPDLDTLIFLIGVQELGKGFRKFKKDEKINLMHIAISRLLEPYGYYEFEGRDADGWPHYKVVKKLPPLKAGEQAILMKEAVIAYFEENDWL